VKKGIIFILLTVFLVFASFRIVFASSFSLGGYFGGRILHTKAQEIINWEAMGYVCSVPGTTIAVLPVGSVNGIPTSYFIPSYITSKTRTTPMAGQYILGKYSGTITISCTYPSSPPITITVTPLSIITLFGTSRF